MDNDSNIIHIWELPEKTNDINKSKDYTVIHDGVSLKKIVFEKLYDYFNQNYKVDNMEMLFETLFGKENQRYEEMYTKLDGSIDSYNEVIQNFVNKFATNRDDIRQLERDTTQIGLDIENILKSFKRISNKNIVLSDDLEMIGDSLSETSSQNKEDTTTLSDIKSLASSSNSLKDDIEKTNSHISKSINTIPDQINNSVDIKSQMITENINIVYDKFLAIFDYYKHIHDEEL